MKKILSIITMSISLAVSAQEEILTAEEAFPLNYTLNSSGNVEIYFKIKEGYNLYNNSFSSDSGSSITFISKGKKKNDEFLGETLVSSESANIEVNVSKVKGNEFNFFYQGCKENVVCYPLQIKRIMF